MNKVGWAVIGSGGIARRRTIPEGIIQAENAELKAVYDIDLKINEEVANKFGAFAAKSLEGLFDQDFEAVYVASPAFMHAEHAEFSARAGKNILCEKPLGLDVQQSLKIASVCKDAGVTLGTAFMMRFQSQHQKALNMIQNGTIGKPVYARAQLSCWYPPIDNSWRQDPDKGGGGSLMDLGGHCIDLLEMFFGKVSKLNCFINNNIHNYKVEDSAVVTLFFENGAMGTIDTFFCIPDSSSKNVLELYGSKGCIIAKGTIGQDQSGEMTALIKEDTAEYDAQQQRQNGYGVTISPEPVNTYKAEIEEFSNAILEKRQPSINAEAGIMSQKILSACYKSAREGCVVKINH